jgi:hypothetical protein
MTGTNAGGSGELTAQNRLSSRATALYRWGFSLLAIGAGLWVARLAVHQVESARTPRDLRLLGVDALIIAASAVGAWRAWHLWSVWLVEDTLVVRRSGITRRVPLTALRQISGGSWWTAVVTLWMQRERGVPHKIVFLARGFSGGLTPESGQDPTAELRRRIASAGGAADTARTK